MNHTRTGRPENFAEFTASQLYCRRCGRATPVKSRLLLVLPGGDVIEYVCAACGESLGTRRETRPRELLIGT
ncbi:MAG: hypothetical protein AB1742_00300 [bacterium]